MYILHRNFAGFHHFLSLSDHQVGSGSHHGVEVLGSAFVNQVAGLVRDVSADQGDVSVEVFCLWPDL